MPRRRGTGVGEGRGSEGDLQRSLWELRSGHTRPRSPTWSNLGLSLKAASHAFEGTSAIRSLSLKAAVVPQLKVPPESEGGGGQLWCQRKPVTRAGPSSLKTPQYRTFAPKEKHLMSIDSNLAPHRQPQSLDHSCILSAAAIARVGLRLRTPVITPLLSDCCHDVRPSTHGGAWWR